MAELVMSKFNKMDINAINFDDLPDEDYREAYYPNMTPIENETGLENKLGGSVPFFIEGEKWPSINDIHLTFFGQFTDPRVSDNMLFRIFVYTNNNNNYQNYGTGKIMPILLDDNNINKQIKINPSQNIITYEPHEITGWIIERELREFEYFIDKYSLVDDQKTYEKYNNSKFSPSYDIKVGGTSTFCQYMYDKDKFNNFIQITQSNELPFGWGDSGIAHVFQNKYTDDYYLTFDCC